MTREELRRIWAARQLLATAAASPLDVARRGGWIHSAGGAGPYLAMWARGAITTRKELDDLVFQSRQLEEVLTVRGATMLVPQAEVPLALAAGRRANHDRLARLTKQCDVNEREVRRLAAAILETLDDGPASSTALRSRIPARLIRDLGPAGRKLGESSTLAVALRALQMSGDVVRLSESRKLDEPRFTWGKRDRRLTPIDADLVLPELARSFLSWAAPARVSDFAWWADVSKRIAKQLFDDLGAAVLEIESGSEAFIQLHAGPALKSAPIVFLPFRDNLLSLHRGLDVVIDDPSTEVLDWMNRRIPAADAEALHQNPIAAGGSVIGVWEFDPEAQEVGWMTWTSSPARVRSEVAHQAAALQAFIRDELGDARYYPFDTEKTRRPRIEFTKHAPKA